MRHRSCVTGTFLVAATLMGATPAAAAVKATPNPAGNGMTTITGQCGGSPQSAEPATLVVNDNSSNRSGGWGAAHIYGTHDVLVPTSVSVLLIDAGQSYLIGSQTKGSDQQSFSVNCFFYQAQTPGGAPLTAQDLLDQEGLTSLPVGVQPGDLVTVEFLVEAVAPRGTPYPSI